MSDIKESRIITKSVGKNFAKGSPIVLEKTSQTALAFYPEVHPGGVKGELVRLKKDKNDKWEKLEAIDFRKLDLYQGTKTALGTDQVRILVEGINQLNEISQQGIQIGTSEYLVTPKESTIIIDDRNKKAAIEQILALGDSDELWDMLVKSDPGFANRISSSHIHMQRDAVIAELNERVNSDKKFHETIGDDSWQKWVYQHNWLFGVSYHAAIEKQKVNIAGIMPDYLFLTTDGYVDILEIKLPDAKVIVPDSNHSGSWIWCPESNKAIGQVVNYLNEMHDCRLLIEKNIQKIYKDASALKPRAFILIGNSKYWDQDKKDGLRKLNHSLHGIEVITYDHLIKRGEAFIKAGSGIND